MCSSGSATAMDRLLSALDELAADDLSPMFGPQVLDRLGGLELAANRLDALRARTVREGELTQAPERDGLKTMGAWLRGHARLSPAAAARSVRIGRALEHLPAVAAGCAAGAITADAAGVIAAVAKPDALALAQAQGVDLGEIDAVLAELAATRPHQELAQVVHVYLQRLDQDGPEPDPTEGRRLTVVRHADGSGTFRGDLDAVGMERFAVAIESIVQAGRCAGDDRTRSQQNADALVQLCDLHLASGNLPVLRKHKPQVVVRLGLDDLADPATGHGAAQLGSGALVSAARARWLACGGNMTRIVFGPDGAVVDMGRESRLDTPSQRRALDARDRGCVFAGCEAPSWWCDAHHLLEWIAGGDTDLDNLALLCERHHTKVHHGFRVERQPDGVWRTWRPDGTEIVLGPAPPIAA